LIDIKMKTVILLISLLFMIGCVGVTPRTTKPPSPLAQEEEEKVPERLQKEMLSDEELFNLGLSYLSSPELSPDYPNAFLAFKRLTENYPESKRKDIAQHFTTLLERYLKLSVEDSRLHLENQELMKEKPSFIQEKTAWEEEKDRLFKENATLKSDLECLKQIEIESEKREKNVR
jgi:hypothetical protein